jgi:RND family efflux transporter MFP subunit
MRGTLLPSLLLLTACSGGTATEPAADQPVAQVRTAVAMLGSSSNDVSVYGVAEAGPGGQRSLTAPAEAVVGTILAPTGTAVRVGQPVVKLWPSPATRVQIAKAASDAAVAEAAYHRASRLRGDGLVSNAEVETASATAQTTAATLANLGISGDGKTLRAPVAGTVGGLTAKPGDQVAAGATVATIASRGDLRGRFGVDPVAAERVHVGAPIIIARADGGAAFRVNVVGVDPQVDPTTRLAGVFVGIPAAAGLQPGEPLHATLSVGATRNSITIPYAALLDDGGRSYVFIVRNHVAKSVDVQPGNTSGDRVEILRGLQPGDKVVVEGGTALEDGMAVRDQRAQAAK